jgi:hypothetical protein
METSTQLKLMKNQRTSIALTQAEKRLVGLKAINPALDFGNDRSITKLNLQTAELRSKLAEYNDAIALLESRKKEIRNLEKDINELSSVMLEGVGFEYGQDSDEYEMAGGVRTSDRVRKSRITRMKSATAA